LEGDLLMCCVTLVEGLRTRRQKDVSNEQYHAHFVCSIKSQSCVPQGCSVCHAAESEKTQLSHCIS